MGAGSVGCLVGGRLAAAGARAHFIGRPRVVNVLRTQGLTLSDVGGPTLHVAPDALDASELPPDGAAPGLVLLAVKSAGTEAAAAQLACVLPAGTPVLSLQNGVDNAARAQSAAPQLRVVPGMVPFNVAELAPGHLHRGTQGVLAAQHDVASTPWLPLFARAGLPLALHADLAPVQWGKLLLNLNNPVNALSRLPLRAELMQRDWRRCCAALMDEALGVLRAAGMEPARVAPVPPRWLPTLLRLQTRCSPAWQRACCASTRKRDRAWPTTWRWAGAPRSTRCAARWCGWRGRMAWPRRATRACCNCWMVAGPKRRR